MTKLFTEPKIIFRQTADSIRCTFDDEGWFMIDSILIFKKNSDEFDYKFLTGVLNSKVTNYIYQNITQEIGRGFAQVKPVNVRKLYIPNIGLDQQNEIIALVDKILEAKKADASADTSSLEKEIDLLVYKLYNLSEKEIEIVES